MWELWSVVPSDLCIYYPQWQTSWNGRRMRTTLKEGDGTDSWGPAAVGR